MTFSVYAFIKRQSITIKKQYKAIKHIMNNINYFHIQMFCLGLINNKEIINTNTNTVKCKPSVPSID